MILIAAGPLPTDAVVGHETLYSQSQTLGPDRRPRLVDEGRVSFGRLTVYPLSHHDLPAMMLRRPDLAGRAFDVIEFPFSLDPLPGSRQYVRIDYDVTLATDGVIAHSLWPETVTTQIDVEQSRTFSLDVDLSFIGLPSPPSVENGKVFRYQELQPTITTRGRGTSRFGWTFLEADSQPVIPTGRTVLAVLERPVNSAAFSGTLGVTAHIRRRTLPGLRPTEAHTRLRPFRLNTADGSFELGDAN